MASVFVAAAISATEAGGAKSMSGVGCGSDVLSSSLVFSSTLTTSGVAGGVSTGAVIVGVGIAGVETTTEGDTATSEVARDAAVAVVVVVVVTETV